MDLHLIADTPPWEWPGDAGKTILRVIRNRRGAALEDRLLAAELAANVLVMEDEVAELLLAVLQDSREPEELRATAALSLGPVLEEMDTDGFDGFVTEPSISKAMFARIQETLRRVHGDEGAPSLVRRTAIEASVRASQDWHKAAIREAFVRDDEDDDWKLTALFCMGKVRGFEAEILQVVESGNPEMLREAVRAAGEWELQAAWPRVRALLESTTTEKPLLLAAIGAAAGLRVADAEAILAGLAESEDEEIAEAADEALLLAGLGGDIDDESSPFF